MDNEYLWIGVSMLGIAQLNITYKENGITITALPAEKLYLMDVFKEFTKRGVDVHPSNTLIEDFLYDFSRVLSIRGTLEWQAFFIYLPPAERVKNLLECYNFIQET